MSKKYKTVCLRPANIFSNKEKMIFNVILEQISTFYWYFEKFPIN